MREFEETKVTDTSTPNSTDSVGAVDDEKKESGQEIDMGVETLAAGHRFQDESKFSASQIN